MRWLLLAVVFVLLAMSVSSVGAQNVGLPPHSCGFITSTSVIHDRIDSGGYAPRLTAGSQSQFDCITSRDPSFLAQRFPSAVSAGNYWLTLLSAELGVTLVPIPISQSGL